MTSPREVLTQLLSPAQGDTLNAAGIDAWEAALSALGAIFDTAPGLEGIDARLAMPDEIAGEFGERHLVAPVSLSTKQDQSAVAHIVLPTEAAAGFFSSEADNPDDEEQQTVVMASTVLGQVLQAINRQSFGNSPSGIVFSLDDLVANTMPGLLEAMDEPCLVMTAEVHGEKPLPLTFVIGGTFLDIVAGSYLGSAPAAEAPSEAPAPAAGASSFLLTEDDLDSAEILEFEPPSASVFAPPPPPPEGEPELVTAGAPLEPPMASPEPTPIRRAASALRAQFAPLPDSPAAHAPSPIDLLAGLQMNVSVELGRTEMTVSDVLGLGPGSVVELDRLAGEPVDILVNDRLIARGEVVVVDENFGVRIVEVVRRGGGAREQTG
jgi:flagellar motor switch protein FliN/FliY